VLFETGDDIILGDIQEMESALLILYTATILYCKEYKLPCKFTSFKSDRVGVRAKTKTHSEGRAFDLSVKGWGDVQIHRFVFMMNNDYRDIAAVSASDGNPRAAVYHEYNGQGSHIHLQVKRNANYRKYMKWDFN